MAAVVAALTDALAAHLRSTARQPEFLPRDGDVHALFDVCLPPRDWAEPARK